MERILELAKKQAEKAEVFRIEKQAAPACFYGGKLTALEGEESVSTALRVIVDGRMGFSSSTHPDDVQGLVGRAVRSAKFGPEVAISFPRDKKNFGRELYFDPAVETLSYQNLIDTGRQMADIVLGRFPDVNLELEVSKEINRISIMNTDGGHIVYDKTMHQAFLNVLMVLQSDRAELEHTFSSTHLTEGPIQMARDAVWRFGHCNRVVPVQTKKMTVVFTSLAFRALFVPLFYGLNGELAHKKLSLLSGRMNENVLHPSVTIMDDATMKGMPGSCPADDEGVITSPKPLFDQGVLKNFIYDLRSAGKAAVPSTGNGFKKSSLYTGFSVDTPPNPTASNFYIPGGQKSRDEIIRSIRDGIIVDDTIGAGQGNNLNGEFSVNVALGYRIQKGEITGRVKDVMVAGNVFEILKNNVRDLSIETWPEDTLFGRYRVPWIALEDLPVSAT